MNGILILNIGQGGICVSVCAHSSTIQRVLLRKKFYTAIISGDTPYKCINALERFTSAQDSAIKMKKKIKQIYF